MKIGPFSKAPATIRVAPVSETDRANASMKEVIKAVFSMGSVTVLSAVSGAAPNVLAASSYSRL